MLKRFRRDGKGFTLIELLIVVAIIGVLAAIAIPNLLSAQKRAKISKAVADTRQIVSQTQLYYNDTNLYPPDVAGLVTAKYISQVYDPFGAAPSTQNYGFGYPGLPAAGSPMWALSVGPPGGGATAPTTPHAAATPGTGCTGEVGFQTDFGAITVTGC